MTEQVKYKPGDFYRICDRTGFKVRASRTKKEWNGLIVRKESWEARQPQDLVRGIADHQVVPEPRPRGHTYYEKIPVVLTSSGNPANYGPPLLTPDGSLIYRGPGLLPDELPVVKPEDYPRSW